MTTYKKMVPEIKVQWVKALRSGKYEQGEGILRSKADNTYCCLGVLCDLRIQAGVGEWLADSGYMSFYGFKAENNVNIYIGLLPSQVYKDTSLDEEAAEVLINMNDKGEPFEVIADWIEENL